MLQEQEIGMRVISYFSKALKGHEKNYSDFLLELDEAAQAIESFHHYLHGVPFTLMCDHKPLEQLGTVHKMTLLFLQELMGEYNFVTDYLPGKMNKLADALSRAPNICSVLHCPGRRPQSRSS